jgi:hypothetical protein
MEDAKVTLAEALAQVEQLERDAVIFAKKPWSHASEALIGKLGARGRVPDDVRMAGYEYFLDIPVAIEGLGVFGARTPTLDEKIRLLLYYGENDAYPDRVYDGDAS